MTKEESLLSLVKNWPANEGMIADLRLNWTQVKVDNIDSKTGLEGKDSFHLKYETRESHRFVELLLAVWMCCYL